MNNEREMLRKDATQLARAFLGWLRKPRKASEDGRSPGRDQDQGPPDYEAEVPPTISLCFSKNDTTINNIILNQEQKPNLFHNGPPSIYSKQQPI
jgi:hypothetical protein